MEVLPVKLNHISPLGDRFESPWTESRLTALIQFDCALLRYGNSSNSKLVRIPIIGIRFIRGELVCIVFVFWFTLHWISKGSLPVLVSGGLTAVCFHRLLFVSFNKSLNGFSFSTGCLFLFVGYFSVALFSSSNSGQEVLSYWHLPFCIGS